MKPNYNHHYVGSVFDIQLNSQFKSASILVQRTTNDASPVSLGQFILLSVPDSPQSYLGVAEEQKNDLPEGLRPKDAMKQSKKAKRDLDALYTEAFQYLSYKVKLLGVCNVNGETLDFHPGVRSTPSEPKLVAYLPCAKFLTKLFASNALKTAEESDLVISFPFGNLRYGSNPEDNLHYNRESGNEVPVMFNAGNLMAKRTAIFGKSGYGKSNATKAVIGMITAKNPNCGILVVDTNGEYGLSNSQNDGMMNIFKEAGQTDKVVLYTNRTFDNGTMKAYPGCIKPLKFDVYNHIQSAFKIVEQKLAQEKLTGVQFLEAWFGALRESDDNKELFKGHKYAIGLIWSFYYQLLKNCGLQPVNTNHTNGNPLNVSKKFLDHLVMKQTAEAEEESDDIGEESEEGDSKSKASKASPFDSLPGDMQKKLIDLHKIHKTNSGHYICTHIPTMQDYAVFWNRVLRKDDTDLKGFAGVLDKPGRFYSLKSYHVRPDAEASSRALSIEAQIFEDLKNNKLVIFDMPSVGLLVGKSLITRIFASLLDTTQAWFQDHNKIASFNRFNAVVFIEEAQNYLSKEAIKESPIYERLAKEGRKMHIGLCYVTQQPSAIDFSIASQTENIVALHMSTVGDAEALGKINPKFDKLTTEFLREEATKGLAYIYQDPGTPFVVPTQIRKFDKNLILGKSD